jgi:hypothetical protein
MNKKILSVVIGIVFAFVALEFLIRSGSYLFNRKQAKENINHNLSQELKNKKTIKIVTVGESTTAVAANEENTLLVQETAYPRYLEKYLNEMQSDVVFEVINKGIMSGDTNKIVAELKLFLKSYRPDLIVTMMGMKDVHESGQGNWLNVLSEYSRVFNLIKVWKEQIFLKNKDIDDSKLINNYEDLNKDFLDLATQDIYLNLSKQLETDQFNDQLIQKFMKEAILGNYFYNTGNLERAEKIFKGMITKYNYGHFLLADLFMRKNDLANAESVLLQYKNHGSRNSYLYQELILLNLNQGKNTEAHLYENQAKKEHLDNTLPVSIALSYLNKSEKKFNEGIGRLENFCGLKNYLQITDQIIKKEKNQYYKNIRTRNDNFECLYLLADLYYSNKELDKSELLLDHYIKYNPNSFTGINLLKKVYEDQNKIDKTEKLLKVIADKNNRLGEYFALVEYYKNTNRNIEIERIYNESKNDFPQTTKNYLEVSRLANESGAKLILMQYPTFSLNYLKSFTSDIHNAIYVSNEFIFSDGPKSKYLFEPRYPYKFNHYTDLGSQLLAKNLAQEILKKLKEGKL